jgi:Type II intron maturase
MRKGKPIHLMQRVNDTAYNIVAQYQAEYVGIVQYYRLTYNLHQLSKLKWMMEVSLVKTLAKKYKTTCARIYQLDQPGFDPCQTQFLARMGTGISSTPSSPKEILWKTAYQRSAWTVVDLEYVQGGITQTKKWYPIIKTPVPTLVMWKPDCSYLVRIE